MASSIKTGTYVFATFAALSFVVSAIKGFVPIYLLESVGWTALAVYWQSRTTHNKTSEVLVVFLALAVAVGEITEIALGPRLRLQGTKIAVNAGSAVKPPDELRTSPPPLPLCPSGLPSGGKTIEIPPTGVEGTNAEAWYVAPSEGEGLRGHWYFHFTVLNKTANFCVTTIKYDVQLESSGAIINGHGEKHIKPLSPFWSYTPQEADHDDELKLESRPKTGVLSSWKITTVLLDLVPTDFTSKEMRSDDDDTQRSVL